MPESAEAKWLHENWEGILSNFEDQWIAVYGNEVIAHDKDFEVVITRATEITRRTNGHEPLYAFVEVGDES